MPPTSSEQTMSLKTPSSREDSCDSEQESQTSCDTDVPSPDAAPDAKAGNPSEEPVGDSPSDADEPGEDPLPGEEIPAEDAPGEGPSAETPAEAPTGGTREDDEQPSDGEREGLGTITTDVIAPLPLDPRKNARREQEGWYRDHRVIYFIGGIALICLVAAFSAMGSCGKGFHDPQADIVKSQVAAAASKQGKAADDPGDDSSAADATTDESKPAADESDAEKAVHATLKGYYDKLKDYDGQVTKAEETYAGPYSNRDHAVREAARQEALTLTSTIQADLDALNAAGITDGSSYHAQLLLVAQCYQDLVTRMGTINDSWSRCVLYNYPDYYPNELMELVNGSKASGSDQPAAKVDFDAAYAQIAL